MRAEFLTHHVRCEILRRNTKTVLVMTDCPITRQLLSTLLWLKKYKVVMRSSSDAAKIHEQCAPAPPPLACSSARASSLQLRLCRPGRFRGNASPPYPPWPGVGGGLTGRGLTDKTGGCNMGRGRLCWALPSGGGAAGSELMVVAESLSLSLVWVFCSGGPMFRSSHT